MAFVGVLGPWITDDSSFLRTLTVKKPLTILCFKRFFFSLAALKIVPVVPFHVILGGNGQKVFMLALFSDPLTKTKAVIKRIVKTTDLLV